jgi:hypothetical protein
MPLLGQVPELLDRALKAQGIPIDGVSFGTLDDPSTWTVHYRPEATKEQRETAEHALQAFDLTTVATVAAEADADARLNEPVTRALVAFLAAHFKLSETEVRDELLAGVKGAAASLADAERPE